MKPLMPTPPISGLEEYKVRCIVAKAGDTVELPVNAKGITLLPSNEHGDAVEIWFLEGRRK